MSRRKNKKYSKELKLEAVQAYLNGEGNYEVLRKRFGLLSATQLRNWVKWYNGHKEFKERRGARTEIYMTKGRKTTQEERVEIVAFCIEHGKNYPLTIQTYGVSYQQINGLGCGPEIPERRGCRVRKRILCRDRKR